MAASHQGRAPSLDGCFGKLRRANEHIQAVKAQIESGTPFVTLTEHRQFDSSTQTLRLAAKVVDVPPLPSGWSLPIGDAIQNIRAALDYLAYELVALEAGGVYWEDTQFPIATDPSKHTGWRDKETIKRLGRHWAVIQGYQPYAGSDPPSLWELLFDYLSGFSNQDKHRLLVPVAATIELNWALPILMPTKDLRRAGNGYFNVGPLKPGTVLAWEDFLVVGPDPQVYVNPNYTPLICFEQVATVGVSDLLGMIHSKASTLIGGFAHLF